MWKKCFTSQLKVQAKKLCLKLNLERLASSIESSKRLFLEVFFSAKTHKAGVPLRVIVSEQDTWQKSIAVFLKEKLNMLTIDDPFLVRSSEEVLSAVKSLSDKSLLGFSIDVKDLYYSLPHHNLLTIVEDRSIISALCHFRMNPVYPSVVF